jgi:hypothetical protein
MRLIDADAIPYCNYDSDNYHYFRAVEDTVIDEMPTIDPVKHGKWVLGYVEPGYFTPGGNRPWICSECGEIKSFRLDKPNDRYCSDCGARMDGE